VSQRIIVVAVVHYEFIELAAVEMKKFSEKKRMLFDFQMYFSKGRV